MNLNKAHPLFRALFVIVSFTTRPLVTLDCDGKQVSETNYSRLARL